MKIPFRTGTVRISSPYGNRILNGVQNWHSGLDFVGDVKDKQIVSVADGVVVQSRIVTDKSNRTWEWGNYVSVRGDDGKTIYYCHMSQRKVSQGQRVKAGDVLGIEGCTGYSFGSHVHFEVRDGNNNVLNPAQYLGVSNAVQSFDAATVWGSNYADLVCQKCGLEQQTKDYLNKYKFAADLWRKLWEKMK